MEDIKRKISIFFKISIAAGILCIISNCIDFLVVFVENENLELASTITFLTGVFTWGLCFVGAGFLFRKIGLKKTGVLIAGLSLLLWGFPYIFQLNMDEPAELSDLHSMIFIYLISLIGPAIYCYVLRDQKNNDENFLWISSKGMRIYFISNLIMIWVLGKMMNVSLWDNSGVGVILLNNQLFVLSVLNIAIIIGLIICVYGIADYKVFLDTLEEENVVDVSAEPREIKPVVRENGVDMSAEPREIKPVMREKVVDKPAEPREVKPAVRKGSKQTNETLSEEIGKTNRKIVWIVGGVCLLILVILWLWLIPGGESKSNSEELSYSKSYDYEYGYDSDDDINNDDYYDDASTSSKELRIKVYDGLTTPLAPQGGNTYYVSNLTDGDLATGWAINLENEDYENSKIFGPIIRIEPGNRIDYITINNGYGKSRDSYYNNTRAAWIQIYRITAPDTGYPDDEDILYEGSLKDTNETQRLEINKNFDFSRPTEDIRLNFTDKYSNGYYYGDKYKDLVISEIKIYGHPKTTGNNYPSVKSLLSVFHSQKKLELFLQKEGYKYYGSYEYDIWYKNCNVKRIQTGEDQYDFVPSISQNSPSIIKFSKYDGRIEYLNLDVYDEKILTSWQKQIKELGYSLDDYGEGNRGRDWEYSNRSNIDIYIWNDYGDIYSLSFIRKD